MNAINQLIQTRMKKNLTLEQVAQDTKIPIRYLKAIENYQLNKLPKSDLTTMYLRTYAQYLELSPNPILELFDESEDAASSHSMQPESTESSSKKSKAANIGRTKWLWYGVPLAVIGLIGIGWLVISSFFTDTKGASQQESYQDTTGSKEVSTVTLPSAKDRAKLELIEPVELNDKYDRYRVTNVDNIELVVTAKSEPTSIEVNRGNQSQMETKALQPNEEVQFTDQQAILVRINQPGQVHVSVNGITVEPSDPSKQVSYRFEVQSEEN